MESKAPLEVSLARFLSLSLSLSLSLFFLFSLGTDVVSEDLPIATTLSFYSQQVKEAGSGLPVTSDVSLVEQLSLRVR